MRVPEDHHLHHQAFRVGRAGRRNTGKQRVFRQWSSCMNECGSRYRPSRAIISVTAPSTRRGTAPVM